MNLNLCRQSCPNHFPCSSMKEHVWFSAGCKSAQLVKLWASVPSVHLQSRRQLGPHEVMLLLKPIQRDVIVQSQSLTTSVTPKRRVTNEPMLVYCCYLQKIRITVLCYRNVLMHKLYCNELTGLILMILACIFMTCELGKKIILWLWHNRRQLTATCFTEPLRIRPRQWVVDDVICVACELNIFCLGGKKRLSLHK